MEKLLIRWGFWAGVVCTVIALAWRAANVFGFYVSSVAPGITVYYQSFYKAALLFFVLSIAAAHSAAAPKER